MCAPNEIHRSSIGKSPRKCQRNQSPISAKPIYNRLEFFERRNSDRSEFIERRKSCRLVWRLYRHSTGIVPAYQHCTDVVLA
jgi:hypothetical protein